MCICRLIQRNLKWFRFPCVWSVKLQNDTKMLLLSRRIPLYLKLEMLPLNATSLQELALCIAILFGFADVAAWFAKQSRACPTCPRLHVNLQFGPATPDVNPLWHTFGISDWSKQYSPRATLTELENLRIYVFNPPSKLNAVFKRLITRPKPWRSDPPLRVGGFADWSASEPSPTGCGFADWSNIGPNPSSADWSDYAKEPSQCCQGLHRYAKNQGSWSEHESTSNLVHRRKGSFQ